MGVCATLYFHKWLEVCTKFDSHIMVEDFCKRRRKYDAQGLANFESSDRHMFVEVCNYTAIRFCSKCALDHHNMVEDVANFDINMIVNGFLQTLQTCYYHSFVKVCNMAIICWSTCAHIGLESLPRV